MDSALNLQKGASVLRYVCRLYFPRYPPHYFPVYMLFRYNCIRKRRKTFELVALPYEAVERLIARDGDTFNDDINNALLVSKTYLRSLGIEADVVVIDSKPSRLVAVSGIREDRAYTSDTLRHNRRRVTSTPFSYTTASRLPKADELDLSAISTCHDLGGALIDSLVTNYFRSPKVVCVGDVVSVELERYAPEFRYTNGKLRGLRFVHFRCNRLLVKEAEREFAMVVLGETSIKQSANVQSFVPPIVSRMVTFEREDCERWSIDCCPYGLRGYFDRVVKAVRPFLKSNAIKLRPAFLVLGAKGSGKSTLTSSVASSLGLHLMAVTSGEINASVYAQTESKLRHLFFKAKLCSPCLVHVKNFENFGKNNEGVYDDRILSFFGAQLEELFVRNNFPVILVCTSETKEIPATLTRHFLEIFEIATPNKAERAENLRWLLEGRNLDANLDDVAEKTHGFLLGDLRALVFYSGRQLDFDSALDRMQAKYSESLGAPKIPKVQWSDVGGLGDVKHEIVRTINLPLQHPELLRSTGLKRSGILLYGPPGTGKTLIAKAVATECNLCFLSVKGPELLNMYVGQSEQNVRQVFERARDAAPCIIFFDELDSLAPNRGISGDSGGVMDRVVSQLLAEMDGLNQSATVFIIGATNRPDLIDPALLRPGRFDKLLYVGPCTDADSKIGVLKALTRRFKLSADVDLETIVRICPTNVTGADFYGLCSSAWASCVRRLIESDTDNDGLTHDDVIVELSDFRCALAGLQPSIKNEDLEYFERLRTEYAGES